MNIRIPIALALTFTSSVLASGCRYKTCEGWDPPEKQPNVFAELAGNENHQWQISGRLDLPLTKQDE